MDIAQGSNVVLSLDPPSTEPSEEELSPLLTNPIPFGAPPAYNTVRLPTKPVTYSFSRLSFNSLILIPPPESPDSRPLYHISVNINVFNPMSHITIIHRGPTEDDPYVGEFETGISSNDATVYMGGVETPLSTRLSKRGSAQAGRWSWTGPDLKHKLAWNCEVTPRICHAVNNHNVVYARFKPSNKLRKANTPPELSTLQISPAGQAFLDDILMSVLLIEQQRLCPRVGVDIKSLFNFKLSQRFRNT
ncbi:uncharacterized protein EV420DRAFT_1643695 [Desarmillaria tabescens]|uniref:DUF6593 domain-containing protein n=1 Tax=Armillaria tabescens TaxID=1929756 RepID=A0AA39KDA6_ARMTA|nr:uncharacterized protein EV420DRAFT_1643695 [Desarmillaria tabescens]KAK0457845.1 hypothetical protein EV420DRAFT_1643695 [Desarmillaria tabescens]